MRGRYKVTIEIADGDSGDVIRHSAEYNKKELGRFGDAAMLLYVRSADILRKLVTEAGRLTDNRARKAN